MKKEKTNTEGNLSVIRKQVAFFFLFFILSALAFIDCTNKIKTSNMNEIMTITGICSLEPNPCLSKPCLPGMVLGVKTKETIYFIRQDGHFVDENFQWKGIPLMSGDELEIKGKTGIMTDIFEERFFVIEINSLALKNSNE